ncbi:ABC transporter substrate-binding protein [Methylomonas rhizoryzae]|uniref:ABC transporter substrate-binding protein n=1 Tax=Methylomonas rhizoryzae TaxID=2608981 RepID=UPI00123241C6|nr:ABC transporter substrate-binding protein [Methylomonas rhizoryzae]
MVYRYLALGLLFWISPGVWAADGFEPVRLQLKWKHQFQFAGYYAALEKGFYRDAGLDVRIVEGGPERPPVETVVAGLADFGVSNSQLILERGKRQPVVVLAPIIQHSPLSLVVKRDSGISTVADLAGKRLMIGPDDAELQAYFRDSGLKAGDYQRQVHSQDVHDLIDDRTDGLSAYTPDQPYTLYKAGVDYLELRAINAGIDFYGDTLFTSEDYLSRHPEQVSAFRAASLKGWAYAMQHPEEVALLIHQRYAPDRSMEHLLWEAMQYRPFIMADLIELGHNSVSRWRHIADVYIRLGMLPADFDMRGMFYQTEALDFGRVYPWLIGLAVLVLLFAGFAAFAQHGRRTLYRLHNRQEMLAANLPGVIYQYLLRADGSACFPYASIGLYDVFGVPPDQVGEDASPIFQVMHPDDVQRVKNGIRTSAERLTVWQDEYRVKHPVKGEIWVEGRASPMRTENGDVLWHGFIADISQRKQLVRQLQESETRFRQMFEYIPVAYQALDVNGKFVDFNDGLQHLLGYNREQLLGMCFSDLWHDDDNLAWAGLFASLEIQESISDELTLLRQNGIPVTVLIDCRVQRDERGRFQRIHCILHNITERKAMEEAITKSEHKFRNIAATVPGMLCDYVFPPHRNARFLYAGPRCRDILGLEPEALLADFSLFLQMLHPDDLVSLALEQQAAEMNGRVFNVECRIKLASGQAKWIQIVSQANPATADESAVWSGIILDVTERKRIEENLARAKEAAEAANRAKSVFLSSVSHELRTPLNAIIGFSHLLETDVEEPLSKSQAESLSYIARSGQHLLKLVNEILDLARIEAGKMDLEIAPVLLRSLFQECLPLFANMAAEKQVTMNTCGVCPKGPDSEGLSEWQAICQTGMLAVMADRSRLRQVLNNLLSNAIKYNRAGGSVNLRCSVRGDSVRISVTDSGKGIAEQYWPEMFTPFHRLGAENSAIEGSGIGLVICKQLVEAMNGAIGFESQQDVGSTFWIELPVADFSVLNGAGIGEQREEAKHTRALPDVHGTVVYIEDNLTNAMLMQHILRRVPGITLRHFQAAEPALTELEQLEADLVFVDVNLPGMNGVEALRRIKNNPATAELPVVAITADALNGAGIAEEHAGFADYLIKPFDVDQLMMVLQRLIGVRQEQTACDPFMPENNPLSLPGPVCPEPGRQANGI